MSPDVVVVRVAGPWETATERGISRFVARMAGGRLSLNVDWISDAGRIVQSIPIDTPPGAENLPLARVRSESDPTDSAVYFDTAGGETFVLIVGMPGEARFGPASN